MNERYGPQILRMGVIIALLVGVGIALVLYMEGQGSTHLEREQARADKLGWIVPFGQPLPPITPEERIVLDAESKAMAMLPARNDEPLYEDALAKFKDPEIIKRTEAATRHLSGTRANISAIRSPIMGADQMPVSRMIVVPALAIRAEALARQGDRDGAVDTLATAAALANVFSGNNSAGSNLYLDARVRLAWCRIAVEYPDIEPMPDLSNLLGYERVIFRRRVNEFYRLEEGRDLKRIKNRREAFDRLRMANQLVEQNDTKSKDLLECWKFVRDGIRSYAFGSLQNHMPRISSMLKAQLVRNQIPKLFAEALRSPGVEPASLAQSKDPYNNLKPLKFRTIKGGFAIYSVGDDAVDGKANALDFGVKVVNGRVLANLSGERFGPWQ